MSKHTPADWYATEDEKNLGSYLIKKSKTDVIAVIPENGFTQEERNANAGLIAEAPAMYDLLKRIEMHFVINPPGVDANGNNLKKMVEDLLTSIHPK